MFRFGKGYTLQVKIKLTGPSQVDAAGSKKSLLESGSAAKIPAISSATATKNFHDFIHETFQDVTLIEEHQVKNHKCGGLMHSYSLLPWVGCNHLST